jgi:hypothetical protein
MLLGVLVLGLIGTGAELVLLGHDESLIQWIPLVLIVVGLGVTTWHLTAESRSSLLAMRVTMIAFIVGGALGVVLHLAGSVQFQRELDPSVEGFTLFMKAMQSKAPPALAPGTMTYMGLFGLVCTYLLANRGENA